MSETYHKGKHIYHRADLVEIQHPDFEVHSFETLGNRVGYHRSRMTQLAGQGRIKFLATNFSVERRGMFAISKEEIERLKSMREYNAERKPKKNLGLKTWTPEKLTSIVGTRSR